MTRLLAVEMHTVGQDRTAGQGTEAFKSFQWSGVATSQGIGDICRVFSDMDVHDGAEFYSQAASRANGLVRYGEAGVQPDEST